MGDERRGGMPAVVAPSVRTPHSPIRIFLLFLPFLLAACAGGPGRGAPTALPPDVIRPAQPTPIFENSANVFRLTPDPTSRPQPAVPSPPALAPVPAPTQAAFEQLRNWLPDRPPTALAIVRGSAALLAAPDGQVLERLGAGATVTVTGLAADGRHVAVFTAAGVPGWVLTDRLFLYGGDDLVEVEQALGAGPIATMLAEAME